MSVAPTTRETADHAELAAELRAFEGSDDLGNGDFTVCEFAADTIETLLSEIAALRGERDEAVELLKQFHTRIMLERRCNSLGVNVAEPIMEKTRAFLANQGADQ